MTEKLNVSFISSISTADNCICSACHGEGKVIKLELPTTLYYNGNGLETRYKNYWVCKKCRDKLTHALYWPKEGE